MKHNSFGALFFSQIPIEQKKTTENLTSKVKKPLGIFSFSIFQQFTWILFSFSVLEQLTIAHAFNVDLRTAVVQKGPKGSMFGYSVAQHGKSW